MPESDMQPSPIADTAMPEEPSTRVGSFSTLLMFCHLTEFLTPLALASYHIATEKFGPGQRGATSTQEHRSTLGELQRAWCWQRSDHSHRRSVDVRANFSCANRVKVSWAMRK